MIADSGDDGPRQLAACDFGLLPHLAERRREENRRFMRFLRTIPSAQVDRWALPVAQKHTAATDCKQCANCCRQVQPGLHDDEVRRLAGCIGISEAEFAQRHLRREPDTGIAYLHALPCIFLNQNRCAVYSKRPLSCQDFPHLLRPGLKFRLRSLLRNYALCPIVFNTWEELKVLTGFRQNDPPAQGDSGNRLQKS